MSITGIGSNYNYLYNAATKRLQTTNEGIEDNFVKWFNGELSDGELPDNLNGFDYNKRRDIKNLFNFLGCVSDGKVYNDSSGDKLYEVSGSVVDAVTSEYAVNGEKTFTAYNTALYTNKEINTFSSTQQSYITRVSKPYDSTTNSINIAVGDVFNLKSGYKLTVLDDCIYAEGYGNGSLEEDKKVNSLVGGLNSLLHFADQQWFSSMMNKEETPMVLELLEQLGVDTSKEFTINGTKCEVKEGRIREVGNRWVVPSSIYNDAIKRYEANLYCPLSEKLYKR